MKIDGIGRLCLWCMEEMGESPCCPYCGHDAREPIQAEQSIPAGQIIGGHYLIGRTLGQGGFGITYLAYDLDLHIKRAIKEYFPQGLVTRVGNTVKVTRQSVQEVYQKGVDSFYREAQAIARFGGHPNVVQVHAFFRENNSAYFVMDYVEGISFQQYLNDRGGRISWEETLRILKPIGEALTALHESRLLHRDVKPDNIFITRNGTPKLLDFGAARYETAETTHSSAAVLTPGYAPVEQYGTMSLQGTFTDVYAFSATFYRAVSGVVPVPSPDRMIADRLLPLDKVDGRVPAQIGAAVSRGMGVRSEKRTQSVAQLLKELETPVKPGLPKWLLPVLAALAILALGIGIGKFSGSVNSPSVQVPEAGEIAAVETEEVPAELSEPTENNTPEAIALQETNAAGTEAAMFSEREKWAVETAEALAAAMEKASEVPTATAEPAANRTAEAISLLETHTAGTQAAWQSLMETEAARPTATTEPTAAIMPAPTQTPIPAMTSTARSADTKEANPAASALPAQVEKPAEIHAERWVRKQLNKTVNEGCYWYRDANVNSDLLGWLAGGTEFEIKSQSGMTKIKTKKGEGWIDPACIAYEDVRETINEADAQSGDYVYYGHYEQDNNKENGAEAIEWRVLAREENRLLLISENGLDAKPYNKESVSITWEECTLRSWLNGAFYESAFSAEEKKQIAVTEVKAEKNPYYYSTNPGNNTEDKIFLLSIQEANSYFKNDADRQCKVTNYAETNNAYSNSNYGGTGRWWLRSPGCFRGRAALVLADGSVNGYGYIVYDYVAVVRPALWLTL